MGSRDGLLEAFDNYANNTILVVTTLSLATVTDNQKVKHLDG